MPSHNITVDILIDDEVKSPLSPEEISKIVTTACAYRGFYRGQIGVRVTNDPEIHQINQTHLQHDYPTDVISFDYGSEGDRIEGELVVSVDTASCQAQELGWEVEKEMALYLIHGTLHVAGMDDQDPTLRRDMRQAETEILSQLGIELPERLSPDGSST